ncbi:MAG: bacillithiol biosynthesis cysteine-adding enzyme BshC, partial [bacterium]
ANIDLLGEDGTFAVITGQQAGLLTGPLLTVYKAITAIQLAERLNRKDERHFVPVFWVVSDDHDFDEVNHLFLVNRKNELVRLVYQPGDEFERWPVGRIPVDEDFDLFFDRFAEDTPNTEFKESVLRTVRAAYVEGWNFAEGFARLMTSMFRDYGLVLVDPMDPDLVELAVPIFEREIEDPASSTSLVLQTGDRLKERGYHRQIKVRPGHLNLFLEIDRRRCSVSVDGDAFRTEGKSYTGEGFLAMLKSSPDRFSPNVVLRPVVRSHLLPTAAYIGGPGEISYFAQLKEVFETFAVSPPVVYPRARVTVVEGKVRRILDRYAIPPAELYEDADGVVRSIVESSLPETFRTAFQEAEGDIERLFRRIRKAVVPIDGSLESLVIRSQNRLAHDIAKIEKKAIQAKKRSEEVIVQQIHKVRTNLFPNGALQERVLNIVPFLILYGPGLIGQLFDAVDGDTGRHQMIDIGT